MMLALRIKGKTMNQGIWAGSRSRKGKEMDTPMEPPERISSAYTLTLAQLD